MKKAETIIAVMEAFDASERKSYENQLLKDRIERMRADAGRTDAPRWANDIYEYGRREIWKKYGDNYYSKAVSVTEDEEGNRKPEGFERWSKRVFNSFPDFMSGEDFREEFGTEMRRMYDEKLAEAMER